MNCQKIQKKVNNSFLIKKMEKKGAITNYKKGAIKW